MFTFFVVGKQHTQGARKIKRTCLREKHPINTGLSTDPNNDDDEDVFVSPRDVHQISCHQTRSASRVRGNEDRANVGAIPRKHNVTFKVTFLLFLCTKTCFSISHVVCYIPHEFTVSTFFICRRQGQQRTRSARL